MVAEVEGVCAQHHRLACTEPFAQCAPGFVVVGFDPIDEIDADSVAYLRTAMDKIIKSYGMKVSKKSKSKIFYYLRRDL
ncbi:MAG: hypothetical protein AAEJ52_17875, partial [Myxococcota bacterium]